MDGVRWWGKGGKRKQTLETHTVNQYVFPAFLLTMLAPKSHTTTPRAWENMTLFRRSRVIVHDNLPMHMMRWYHNDDDGFRRRSVHGGQPPIAFFAGIDIVCQAGGGGGEGRG